MRVEDQLHNTAVLKYAAAVYEEPLFILTADAKDFFNQLMLAVWCRHHVGLFWLSLDAKHELYTFIVEHSLGFVHTGDASCRYLRRRPDCSRIRVFDGSP